MKHFVLAGLLTTLLAATGCVGYRPATSPYYTNYYTTYDPLNNYYYHPSYYGGYNRHHHHHGIDGRNRWNGSGADNFKPAAHDSSQHGSGNHLNGGHGSGGGHSSGSGSHSGGGNHSSSGGGGHK